MPRLVVSGPPLQLSLQSHHDAWPKGMKAMLRGLFVMAILAKVGQWFVYTPGVSHLASQAYPEKKERATCTELALKSIYIYVQI